MRTILITIFASFFTLSAFSQDLKKEIAKCASIENSIERLAAYDALSKSLGVAEPASSNTNGPGKWQTQTDISPIDDSKTLIMTLTANEELKVGHKSVTPTLILRYKEGIIELFISYGDVFIGTDSTVVTTRVDKQEAITQPWGISTNHSAVFEKSSSKLTTTMNGASTLVVRLTPYGESPVTTSFDITGFKDAYLPLLNEFASDINKKYGPANGKKPTKGKKAK